MHDMRYMHDMHCSQADELPERLLYQIQFRQVDTAAAARPLRPEDYAAPPLAGSSVINLTNEIFQVLGSAVLSSAKPGPPRITPGRASSPSFLPQSTRIFSGKSHFGLPIFDLFTSRFLQKQCGEPSGPHPLGSQQAPPHP